MKGGELSVMGYGMCKGPEANIESGPGEMALGAPEDMGRGQILQELVSHVRNFRDFFFLPENNREVNGLNFLKLWMT